MGFWHTGYTEHHERYGLDWPEDTHPPVHYPCAQCVEVYDSIDALRQHRFETHPLFRPTLLLKGVELDANPFRITTLLLENEVYASKCDRAVLNGEVIQIDSLTKTLSSVASGVNHLVLSSGEVSSEYVLDFRIALEEDLDGVEQQFQTLALGRRLSIQAIENFISATSRFSSAIGYCDGICAYLYGVLAKERAPDTSLSYEAYVGKYNKAIEGLIAYNRPLARSICSLIEFHFNHFREAARIGSFVRVGLAANRYRGWLQTQQPATRAMIPTPDFQSSIDTMVIDWETEQITRWAIRPLTELSQHVSDMTAILNSPIAEYDKVKIHILLAEIYSAIGKAENAIQHAKVLRNQAPMERWAESIIKVNSENKFNEH